MPVTTFNWNIADELEPTGSGESWKASCRTYLVWGQYKNALDQATKSGDHLIHAPFGFAATASSFTPFGLDTSSGSVVFKTAWSFSFPSSGASPDVLAMLGGTLSYNEVDERVTITVDWTSERNRQQWAGVEYRDPAWSVWPTSVNYVGVDKTTLQTDIESLLGAAYPAGSEAALRRILVMKRNGILMDAETVEGYLYPKLITVVAEKIISGDYTLFSVNPGDAIGTASIGGSGDFELSLWLGGSEAHHRYDPAFYFCRYSKQCGGLRSGTTTHPAASHFLDHRGVVVARDDGTGSAVFREVSSSLSLRGAITELATLKASFGTVVLGSSEWRDDSSETAASAESLIELEYPLNIVGDSPTRMLRPTYRDPDGNIIEATLTETVLDVALTTNPEPTKLPGELLAYDDASKHETRVIELAVTTGTSLTWRVSEMYEGTESSYSLKASQPWQGTTEYDLTTGVSTTIGMPVIQGGASKSSGGARFRCLLVSVDESLMEGAFISIANIAFFDGGVRVQSLTDGADLRGGGGVCIEKTDRVRLVNCIFADCGAAWRDDSPIPSVSIGNFLGYMYDGAGGGLFCKESSPLVEGCYFRGRFRYSTRGQNQWLLSNTGDGAAFWKFSYPVVEDCHFYRCAARAQAGLELLTYAYPKAGDDLALETAPGQGDWEDLDAGNYLADYDRQGSGLALKPTLVHRCLFDSNTALGAPQDGGSLYASCGAPLVVLDSTMRYGRAQHGGGNATVTFGTEAVFSGCRFENGVATGDGSGTAWDGGGIHARNSDLILVPSLVDGTNCEVSRNVSKEGRGGGLKFLVRPNVGDLSLKEALREKYDELEEAFWVRRNAGPRSAEAEISKYVSAWKKLNPTKTSIGVRLVLAGVSFSDNDAKDASNGLGGACLVLNKDDPDAEIDFQQRARFVSGLVSWDSLNEAALSNGADTTHWLYLEDSAPSTTVTQDDGSLTLSSGVLTSDFSYDS